MPMGDSISFQATHTPWTSWDSGGSGGDGSLRHSQNLLGFVIFVEVGQSLAVIRWYRWKADLPCRHKELSHVQVLVHLTYIKDLLDVSQTTGYSSSVTREYYASLRRKTLSLPSHEHLHQYLSHTFLLGHLQQPNKWQITVTISVSLHFWSLHQFVKWFCGLPINLRYKPSDGASQRFIQNPCLHSPTIA